MPGAEHEDLHPMFRQPIVLDSYAGRTAENSAAFLLSHLKPGMRVLDLGCGPGSITIGLARYVAPAEVIGIDLVDEALAAARRLAGDESVGNVRFEQADLYELPYDDGSFDVVYGHQVLQHLTDPSAALMEAKRVLGPGGYIAVRDADYGTMTHHPHDPLLDDWLAEYHDAARSKGGEPDAGRRLMEWVRAAGFEHIHPTASTWLYATPETRAAWAELWSARRFGSEASDSRRTAVADAFQRWAQHPDAWFAFIHGEVLARKPI